MVVPAAATALILFTLGMRVVAYLGQVSVDHVIEEDAEGPGVGCEGVRLALQDFGRFELGVADQAVADLVRAQVREVLDVLDDGLHAVRLQEVDIVIVQIPNKHAHFVQVLHGRGQLGRNIDYVYLVVGHDLQVLGLEDVPLQGGLLNVVSQRYFVVDLYMKRAGLPLGSCYLSFNL